MQVNLHIRRTRSSPSRLVFLIFFLLMVILYFVLNFLPKGYSLEADLPAEEAELASVKLPPLEEYREKIPSGKSLSDLLGAQGFTAAQIHRMREDAKPVYDLARIKAGQELRLYSFQDGTVVVLEYDIDRMRFLQIEKRGEAYQARIRQRSSEMIVSLVWGSIEDFPLNALARQGEKAALAILLEEVFAWDVDFRTEIRKGDSFRILFEKKFVEGEFAGYGEILAAEFVNRGRSFQAFRFTYPDTGKTDYFNYQGDSLRKAFLKSPLKSPRVTSRFSTNRLHPVWRTYRPHYGVDYGAPVGTRVYATGDGVVTFAGWSGASGRMLRIKHSKGYETMYLHLRRFAPGIKKGVRVTSKQYIAQVGASGAVSGPHLDYRIRHHGKYINPLAARFDPVEPLRPEFSDEFRNRADDYRFAIDAPWLVFQALTGARVFTPPVVSGD